MLSGQLLLGTLIVVLTVVFHVAALVYLSSFLSRIGSKTANSSIQINNMKLLAVTVLFILAIHTIEAWSWGLIYMGIGEFKTLEEALYFSAVTSTTLGYGDLTLSDRWRLLSSFEAMGGLILFGASTAFLLELMRNIFAQKHTNT